MKPHTMRVSQGVQSAAVLLCAAFVAGTASLAVAAQPGADNAAPSSAIADEANSTDGTSRRERRRAERAATDATTEAATSAEPASETTESRLVCKNIKLSGTRIAKPICGRPEQWEAAERRTTATAEEGMRQMRERSAVGAAHTPVTQTPGPQP